MIKGKDLTQGNLLKVMASFSVPYLVSCFLQMLYNIADLFIVGQYCDVPSITAVSIGGQVMHFVTVVIVGLAMGTTVSLAQAVGANDQKRLNQTVGNTITLFMVVGILLACSLIFFVNQVVGLMSTPVEAVEGTRDYLAICFVGVPAIVAYNIIASVFRGMGDSRSPMYFIAVACVLNIVLDLLFVGQMGLGAAGAAWATILAQAMSVLLSFVVIWKRKMIQIKSDDMRLRRNIMSKVLKIGAPISLQDGFIQIGFLAITVIANMRGLTDAAAVGVVEKIIGILFLVPSSLLSTVSVVSAQNIGAGKTDRARMTLRYGIYMVVCAGVVSVVAMQFLSSATVGLFTSDEGVIRSGCQYLESYSWDCIVAGVHFCFSGFFCACGKAVYSFIHNICSITLARLPLSYLASISYADTLYPMGLATVVGSALSVVICLYFYRKMRIKGVI